MSDSSAPPKDDAAPPPIDIAASDAVDAAHKVKRKPSGPGDAEADAGGAAPAASRPEEENGNGHASGEGAGEHEGESTQQAAEAVQQPPSAGAPDTPVDPAPSLHPSLEKPTDGSSTNAIKASRPPESTPKSTPTSKSKSRTSRQKKPSFWSRFLRALVPCVGPSTAHATDVDTASAAPLREKQRDDEKKDKTQEASTSTGHTHTHTAEPSATTTTTPTPAALTLPSQLAPPTPTSAPTPITDSAVIVPPSPKSHRLPKDETMDVTSGAVQPPGSTGGEDPELERERESDRSDSSSFTDEEEHEREVLSPGVGAGAGAGLHEEDLEDEEDRLIMNGGAGIPIGPDGIPRPLLPPVAAHHTGRKCLVLDLDETLVHSSFKLIPQADYVVPVEIEWQWHNVYVIKRPGVDNFLKQMGELYEIVVFTASLSKYADPVLDKLDVHKVVSHRLFRESCYNHKGNYVKDLSQLGRPPTDTIILDNSPASYIFHPNNAVPVSSWFNDPHDTELTDLVPFLADLRTTDDVRGVLDGGL